MTEPNSKTSDSDAHDVPVAVVSQQKSLFASRIWILTALALLLALGLAWSSMPKPGTMIVIHFPEGHGLHEGDAVRFRGIQVGEVKKIELDQDLHAIDVHVDLKPFAGRLASEGANYWIVRPTVGISGVSGLDTAVGPKYVAASPPDDSLVEPKPCHEFEGLAGVPADGMDEDGIEIVLRADKRFSVSTGAAVSYRGVEVGRILSVGLSDDARFVDLRARVFEPHQRLITSNTKFWANSGVDIDFSLRGGFSLDSESLETIARGGVSFLTVESGGQEISPGQIFTLNSQPEDEWLEAANKVRLPTVELKGAVTLIVEATGGGFLGRSKQTRLVSAIPIRTGNRTGIVFPASLLKDFAGEKPVAQSVKLDGTSDETLNQQLFDALRTLATADNESLDEARLSFISVSPSTRLRWQSWPQAFGEDATSGDLVAVRRPSGATESLFLHYPLNASSLEPQDDGAILVREFSGDRDLWHGSPVLSVQTGGILGVLINDGKNTTILPCTEILKAFGE